jgi:hypothetical protein
MDPEGLRLLIPPRDSKVLTTMLPFLDEFDAELA